MLASGARMHIDRHEIEGDRVRCYIGESVAEMSAAKIVRFEAQDTRRRPPPLLPFPLQRRQSQLLPLRPLRRS